MIVLSRLTDFSSSPKGKWIVIAIWVVLAAVVIPLSPTLADVTDNSSANFLPDGTESTQVQQLVDERFPSSTTPAIVVFRSDDGLSDDERAIADEVGRWAQSEEAPEPIDPDQMVSIFTVPQAAASLVSEDGTTMTMVIGIEGDPNSESFLDAVEAIREQVSDPPAGTEIAVSGPGGLILDLISVFETIDVFLTLVTAGLVLVLLVVIYRSPVIALVPLVAVGWVFSMTGAVAAAAAQQFDLLVNGQAQGIATVLLFGAGTDYCLFIASRYREELTRIKDKHEAMRVTMRAIGESIASSAGTVLVATLILSFAVLLRSTAALGPLLSIAIGLMLIAGLTLVPAIVTVLGRFAFWPLGPRYKEPASRDERHDAGGGLWGTAARIVTGRPVALLVASVAVFGIFSLGLLQYRVTYDSISSLPVGAESREGFEWLRDSFPAGESEPIEVYVALDRGVSVYDQLDEIDAMTVELGAFDGVASVDSITSPLGSTGPIDREQVAEAVATVPEEVRQAIDAGDEGELERGAGGNGPRLAQAIGVYASTRPFVSQDNGVARFNVILESSPYAIEQIEEIGPFREYARDVAVETGLEGEVLVGGATAVNYDTKQANDQDTRFIVPFILVAIGAILALLLRSLIAPLYLLGIIAVSYVATLGLTTWLFLNVFEYDGVGSAVPLYLFVFLVALGVDYNIYLMARIREEVERHSLHDGVQVALSRTGGVITSAGIILAGTFGALMTLPLRDLFQLGFAVAIGVLLDTFIVRTIMVPAIVVLLGRWNWWPGRRFRQT